ncbi:MAG: hypothetical protein IT452_04245 [Planctomycetia bacterium]|nr:hypothetical protein [Planctomycetia bacterium]
MDGLLDVHDEMSARGLKCGVPGFPLRVDLSTVSPLFAGFENEVDAPLVTSAPETRSHDAWTILQIWGAESRMPG